MAVNLQYSRKFLKHFNKRIVSNNKLSAQFNRKIKIFVQNPKNPSLKNHQLKGIKQHLHSFSIAKNFRVIYQQINKNHILFIDIGTHDQVYR